MFSNNIYIYIYISCCIHNVINITNDDITNHIVMNIERIDDMMIGIANNIDIKPNTSIKVISSPTNTITISIKNDVRHNISISIRIGFINAIINITINNSSDNIITDISSNNAIITDIMNSLSTPYWK